MDRALWTEMGEFEPTGVNVRLIERVREALDEAGHQRVKIVASGGFNAERIREFEAVGAPVDSYGVGSSLVRGSNDYTADIVEGQRRAVREGGKAPTRQPPAAAGGLTSRPS